MKEVRLKIVGDSAIFVGEVEVAPSASHLFALLLVLTLAPPEGVSRREMQELLFDRTDEEKANHRLRQLLYRLRSFGVVLRHTAGGALQIANPVETFVDGPVHELGSGGTLRVLPHYNPRLPAPFLAWLESSRDRVERLAQTQLLRQLREAHSRQDWSTTSGIAEVVLVTDPLNEEVAVAGAESRAMLGQRDEALEIADRFVREFDGDEEPARAMRKLRARIARTTLSHRDGTMRGREECLTFLAQVWESASAGGGGRLSIVVGPPGIGKSRVAETFAAKIRLDGARVISYQCDRQASQHPLALFSAVLPELQSLSGSLGISPEHHAVLSRLGPGAATVVRELPGLSAVEARRAELQRALIDLLEAVSADRPLLIVVDDAHLLDDASCEVIRTLADSDNSAAVLVAGFTRPRTDGNAALTQARRASSYLLPPLTDQQSRELLAELRAGRPWGEEQIVWTLSQAKGNPFYLYALASMTSDTKTLPAHVRSLATSAYLALTPSARTVLECCLLLDTLATLKRVSRVGGISDNRLLDSLRELEDLDLVHFDGGRLRGPHAILDEALRQLIPASVGAVLHTRIAQGLSEECVAEGYSLSFAWAAVQSWLAAGEPQAAVALACRVAREAAELGEPQPGAELLNQIPRTTLPLGCQRQLLDDLYVLAEAGNCQSIATNALKERMLLAVQHQEDNQTRATISLNLIQNGVYTCNDERGPIDDLIAILRDTTLINGTRFDAGRRIFGLADIRYDCALATSTYNYICSLDRSDTSAATSYAGALLVYHVAFGNIDEALSIIESASKIDRLRESQARWLATNTALALIRIGDYCRARDFATELYERLTVRGEHTSAEFALGIICESELSLGNTDSAARWMRRWEDRATNRVRYQNRYYNGYLSLKFLVAAYMFRTVEAKAILPSYLANSRSNPRHRATSLAHSHLLNHWCNLEPPPANELAELTTLYERGRSFGAQDHVVEALWFALTRSGKHGDASDLLLRYLTIYRRERGLPEFSLRQSTASDPVWSDYKQNADH